MLAADRFYTIAGVQVQAVTLQELNGAIDSAIRLGERRIIAHHNLHSIYLVHSDPLMRAFFEQAQVVHMDGMPLVWLGRLFGYPFKREHRITYVDWIPRLAAEAARRGWRLFYLGSRPGVAERGAGELRSRFPSLEIATAHGYFDARRNSDENRSVLAQIRQYGPQVLLVGMGMPRQEHWVLDNLEDIRANAILTAGAAIDYVAGVVPTPPRWAGRVGLEWLFRLVAEPRRLAYRYLVEPWFVLAILLRHMEGPKLRRRRRPE